MGQRPPAAYPAQRRELPIWAITIICFGIGFCVGGLLIVGFLAYLDHALSQ